MERATKVTAVNLPRPGATSPAPRVAIYIRISKGAETDPDVHGGGLHRQITQMIPWLITKGYVVVALYMDHGQTGDAHRPGLDQLMEAALSPKRPFDFIVVCGFARIYRDNLKLALMERKLGAANISMLSSTAPETGGNDPPRLVKEVLTSFDDYVSAKAREARKTKK